MSDPFTTNPSDIQLFIDTFFSSDIEPLSELASVWGDMIDDRCTEDEFISVGEEIANGARFTLSELLAIAGRLESDE